jgi:hypothetical protein
MIRIAVRSNLIASHAYDADTQTLELELLRKSKPTVVYQYTPFTPARYQEFLDAESKGKHFLKEIRPDASLKVKRLEEQPDAAQKVEAPSEAPTGEEPPDQAA